jgi:hypothetical protein
MIDWNWLLSWPLSWPVNAILQAMLAVVAALRWIEYGRTRQGAAAFWGTACLGAMWFNGLVGDIVK